MEPMAQTTPTTTTVRQMNMTRHDLKKSNNRNATTSTISPTNMRNSPWYVR
jgi:hypothetical protein